MISSPPRARFLPSIDLALLLLPSIVFIPGLRDPFSASKELAFVFILSICFLIVWRSPAIKLPRFDKGSLFAISFLLFNYLLIALTDFSFVDGLFYPFAYMLFFVLGVNLDHSKMLKLAKYSLYLGLGISLVGILQYLQWIDFLRTQHYKASFSFTFGNKNLLSQFLGALLLIQFFFSGQNLKKSRRFFCCISLELCYFVLLHCRSSLLALGLGSVIYLLFVFKKRRKLPFGVITLLKYIIFIGPLLLFLLTSENAINTSIDPDITAQYTSSETLSRRYRMWEATISAVEDKPFGWGLDKFSFEILPYFKKYGLEKQYSDQSFYRTPHNLILRMLFDYGILHVFALLLLIFKIVRLSGGSNIIKTKIILLYFLIDSQFQMILYNLSSVPLLFVFLGFLFHRKYRRIEKGSWGRFPVMVIGIFCFLLMVLKIHSWQVMQLGFPKRSVLSFYCSINQSNWRMCIAHSRLLEMEGENQLAIEQYKQILGRTPHNTVALHDLAMMGLKAGDQYEGCRYLRQIMSFVPSSRAEMRYSKYCLK